MSSANPGEQRPDILLVDDEPGNILVLAKALEERYVTRFATSGSQALALVATHQPDLILLDVMMPGMDGYQVLAALRASEATRRIPVIFVTARADVDSETQALTAGAADFIHKPINPAVLRTRVAVQIDLARHRDHLEDLVHERTRKLAAARDAAESATRAKNNFVANISHELRTPLTTIMGFTEVAQGMVSEPDAIEMLGESMRSSRHLLGLINNLIDLADVEAQRLSIRRVDFSLQEILTRIDATLGEPARNKGLALRIEPDPALAGQVFQGDPLRLGQVLLNLVDNAVKFTRQGSIDIRVECLEVSPDQTTLRFSVSDTGSGIAADDQPRIFALFEQGDASATRRYEGTGLGLALCQRLVDLMNGQIGVRSEPGQGSTFWFSVALGRPAAERRAAA